MSVAAQSNSFKHLLVIVPALVLVLASAPASAASVPGLYDVTIGVASQDPELRSEAASEALLEMLTRLSGLTNIPRNAEISAALDNPERYYSRFGYLAGDETHPTYLTLTFAADAVTRLARKAKLPVWGENRPKLAIWTAVSDGVERNLLGADSDAELMRALQRAAARRGLPIALPLLDLADVGQVSPAVVWGGMTDIVEAASERYAADGVATGRVEARADGSYSATWRYSLGSGSDATPGRVRASGDADQVAMALIDDVANLAASRFAVLGRSLRVVQARVRGVQTPAQYGALVRYLSAHQAFEAVGLQVVDADSLRFGLATRSDDVQLLDLLALDGVLEAAGTGFDGSLELNWLGVDR